MKFRTARRKKKNGVIVVCVVDLHVYFPGFSGWIWLGLSGLGPAFSSAHPEASRAAGRRTRLDSPFVVGAGRRLCVDGDVHRNDLVMLGNLVRALGAFVDEIEKELRSR